MSKSKSAESSSSTSNDYLRCRYCDFKVGKYRRLASGRTVSGFGQLENHIEDFHLDEAMRLQEQLEEHDASIDEELKRAKER